MTLTRTQVAALLAANGLTPSKALGQHFLVDPNTARRIVRLAGVAPGDRVLEVGPGLGSLTLALLDAGAAVTAVELDARLAAVLAEVTHGRCEVVVGDAMTLDLAAVAGAGPVRVVANLPYNVATPIVVRLLEEVPAAASLLVMVQAEVAERLASPPGSRTYGAVSVKVDYYARASVVGRVPRSVFLPEPNVDSALVAVERRATVAVDPGLVERGAAVRGGPRGVRAPAQDAASLARRRGRARGLRAGGRRADATARGARRGGVRAPGGARMTALSAPAKLTWSLHVTGVRPDGLHLLDAEMVSLELADTVELTEPDDDEGTERFAVAVEYPPPRATPRSATTTSCAAPSDSSGGARTSRW